MARAISGNRLPNLSKSFRNIRRRGAGGLLLADFLHHRVALGALTVLYCGLVGALAVDRSILAPREVFATLHDAVAVAAKAVAARVTRIWSWRSERRAGRGSW
jgi:hypothetical protein